MPKEIYASLGNMVALLVEWDIRLLALCSQGQTTLLQLRLGVVPVLVQNELLQHTNNTHLRPNYLSSPTHFKESETMKMNCSYNRSPSLLHAFISFLPSLSFYPLLDLFALSLTGSPSMTWQ